MVNEIKPNISGKKITVALLCSALNDHGGTSQYMADLYIHLDSSRYRVLVVYSSTKEKLLHSFFIAQGVKAEDLFWFAPSKKMLFIPLLIKLKKLFVSERVDVVHTFFLHSDIIGCVAALLSGKKRMISSVVGKFFWDEINGVGKVNQACYKFLNSVIRPYFYRTVTVSQQLYDELIQSHAAKPQKIVAINIGVDIPSDDSVTDIPKRKKENIVIASLSRFTEDKGLKYLLQAVPFVLTEIPNARFIIASSGEEENKLKQLVRDLNIQSSVEFPGWVGNRVEFIRNTDIFAMPSLREGCPVALLEMLSFAKPAVAFAVPGIKEIITNEKNGILVEPFNVEQYAFAMVRLCKDPEYREMLGKNGRILMQEKFSVSAATGRIEELYLSVLSYKN